MPAIKRKRVAAQAKPKSKVTVKKSTTIKLTLNTKKRDTKGSKKATTVSTSSKDISPIKSEDNEQLVEMKSSISNGIIVDHKIPNPSDYTVVKYLNNALDCHLMFADCGHNNNKFYIIQGLKKGSTHYLWTRWGRVGVDGQNALVPCPSDHGLYSMYNSKKRQKVSKGYTEVEISYDDAKETKQPEKPKGSKSKKQSKLPSQVQDLLKFIFDMNQIEQSIIKIGYDAKKLPLGKLSKATVLKGYAALKEIDKELRKKKVDKDALSRLSSEFYRHIPHDFKFQHMSKFIIDTKEKLKEKLNLVDTLNDIQITAEITSTVEESGGDMHELDAKYKMLKCQIKPLSSTTNEYKTLLQTIDMQHSTTSYPTVKVLEIFKLERDGEAKKYKKEIGNRKLLWHGSTFSNWGGILSQGLRIAPPEAPACGYMFGKGVYFADVLHKSSGYTRYYMSNNVGLLALCDVAIGKTYDRTAGDSSITLSNLPKGTNSTLGCGRYVPSKTLELGGSMLQLGPLIDAGGNSYITHNEFITYDVDQIQLKYLFKCQFA